MPTSYACDCLMFVGRPILPILEQAFTWQNTSICHAIFTQKKGLLCHAMLCYALLCSAVFNHVVLCIAWQCSALLRIIMLYLARLVPCYVMLCYAMVSIATLCHGSQEPGLRKTLRRTWVPRELSGTRRWHKRSKNPPAKPTWGKTFKFWQPNMGPNKEASRHW